MLNELSNEWVTFQQTLIDAEGMLKKHKEKFKSSLLAQSEEFKKQVHNLVDEFQTKGPFTSGIQVYYWIPLIYFPSYECAYLHKLI